MSTRGNIAIKLNSSDRVSTLKYNPDVLPAVRRKNNIGDVEAGINHIFRFITTMIVTHHILVKYY